MSLDWPLCIAPRYECVHEWCPELLRYAIYTLCYAIHIYIYMVGERVVHFIYIYTRYALYMQLHCTYANHFYFVF